jgi:hypothetical protein
MGSRLVYQRDGISVFAPSGADLIFNTVREKPHILLGGAEYKHCPRCDTWRRLSKFTESVATWDGLQSYCVVCRAEVDAERHGAAG